MTAEEILDQLRFVQSVEDFEVLADDRATGNATLVVLTAGLALRMFARDPDLVAYYFSVMETIDELDEHLEETLRDIQAGR